jgi:hypothetical protein
VFSIWDKDNNCLSWDDTVIFAALLGLHTVPVMYYQLYNQQAIKNIFHYHSSGNMEGYVCRVAQLFPMSKFENYVAKYVRKGHVQTSEHWLSEPMVRNEMIE